MTDQMEILFDGSEFPGWHDCEFAFERDNIRACYHFTVSAVRDRDDLPVIACYVASEKELAAVPPSQMVTHIHGSLRAQLDSFLSCPCGTFESDGHVIYVPCSLHSSSPPPC